MAMIDRANDALRPPLDRLTALVSSPAAIMLQAVVFGARPEILEQ